MTAHQVYEQTIKPLSTREGLTVVRLIINEVAPDMAPAPQATASFDHLGRLLPQIERITLTDQGLAGAASNRPAPSRKG